ncbi:ATP-dependent RNA helicase RhlB [Thiococcus pfennigii]|jgi:ATP-dependent RNA helicase RhlB|uniref:ATP-dependent RNA helicase RhlB n=1 Tax=Thiococcus pfennigii TaxID=1057 RepID=UPI00190745D8|nr:ATP-dependent RNA helicase RhlB [Thiococcus pfennigii]MBK1733100.1 ATP-dependent RNA helicase RhlB [Thiococcus pfennigii]
MTDTHLTETRFDSFDLDPRILKALDEVGFTHCTPIQAETLPIGLAGRDVAGQAQTGTGKTAAFLIVTLQRLLTSPSPPAGQGSHPRVLILAPTRELAVQIHRDTLALTKYTDFRVGLVYGGTGYQQQRDDLARGVDILIGTPGRLIDYLKQRVFSLGQIEVAILDEADRMFDLGFIKDIRFLLRRMPPPEQRLGLLFSATLSYRVTELAYEHMNNPELIKVEPDRVTAERVTQSGYMVANDEKIPLLIGLLRRLAGARVIVFANTKRETERIWGYLEGNGFKAAILSGDVPQKKRLSLLRHFTAGDLPILVATDVAARGLHIPDVTHVLNYDLPEDAEDYVHRIGRTARAGADGAAISFVCETYAFSLPDIEAFIGAKVPVTHLDPELLAEIDPRSRVRTPRRERLTREDRPRGRPAERGQRPPPRGRRDADLDGPREAPAATAPAAAEAQTERPDASPTAPKKRRRRRRRPAGRTDGAAATTPPAEPS